MRKLVKAMLVKSMIFSFSVIAAPNTYLIYSDTAAKPKMTLQDRSATVINVKNGFFYASGTGAHILSFCTIGRNATLSVTSSANNGFSLFKCSGDFKVNEGGSLLLIMPQSGSSPLMYFSATALTFSSLFSPRFFERSAFMPTPVPTLIAMIII